MSVENQELTTSTRTMIKKGTYIELRGSVRYFLKLLLNPFIMTRWHTLVQRFLPIKQSCDRGISIPATFFFFWKQLIPSGGVYGVDYRSGGYTLMAMGVGGLHPAVGGHSLITKPMNQ